SFPPAPASSELIDNVRMLLSRLKIAKPDQKDGLILQLSGLSDSGAYQASLLPTSEEETVYYLKSSLMRSKDPEAVPYLVHALESDKLFVQLESITLLGILGNLDVTRHLRPFLADSVPAIKSAAIGALQQLADPYAVEGIAELVGDQDDMVRVAAINASLELGKTHNRMDLVSESVRRNLNGADGRVAKELLSMVSRGKMAELWKSVLPFLSDPDALLRKTAAVTLQGIEVPETAEIVVTRLQQEDDLRTLIELTRAASKIKSTTAVPALIHLLGHADPDVVQASAASLEALTRQHFGTNKSKWTQWWDLNQTK
ncbi:MAG TPA: HEAT repeat domain-containing protein, partial [Planctomycetota bacterium]|nr:HEAT repeat domain-containing protein [Planctomycetota bacterium]